MIIISPGHHAGLLFFQKVHFSSRQQKLFLTFQPLYWGLLQNKTTKAKNGVQYIYMFRVWNISAMLNPNLSCTWHVLALNKAGRVIIIGRASAKTFFSTALYQRTRREGRTSQGVGRKPDKECETVQM